MLKNVLLMLCIWGIASAAFANTPCSGSKGGVNHCANGRFVCNDGSISASKRICSSGEDEDATNSLQSALPGPHGVRELLLQRGHVLYRPARWPVLPEARRG
ncbi:hypothetical protein SAMN05428989_3331 [Pseudoxanthomonas sp. GM95]|uniref:YdcA family protein n=1 Tax=Pseudoxanthomonas sp. GM95 TaxID=1881043 RepID=UPI0008B66181|nr:hypothetical protein [Pseudoxanthomonas sp. GM95]SEM19515.1 hypothetical protein SAMN05428989_3331 [Pseudoxanthomonas sp. GM95]